MSIITSISRTRTTTLGTLAMAYITLSEAIVAEGIRPIRIESLEPTVIKNLATRKAVRVMQAWLDAGQIGSLTTDACDLETILMAYRQERERVAMPKVRPDSALGKAARQATRHRRALGDMCWTLFCDLVVTR